jgi:KHA, dimerisation domain of potassium ion channel
LILKLTHFFFISKLTGEKLRMNTADTVLMNGGGAEIESIEIIRDNDKLFVVDKEVGQINGADGANF